MKKLKVVMIGAGNRANQVIYPSFASLEQVEIIGICDINRKRLRDTADLYGIQRRYGSEGMEDYQRMVTELKPDAAVVIGQPHIMYDIWKWCLEQGLHLYVEKPLALSMHQARALAALAERKRLVTQVSLQRRYTPMVKMLRDTCLERGDIVHAVCKFYKSEVRQDMLGARDHMMDDCVHSIDTLRWICGSRVTRVESTTRRIGTVDINFISAVLHFENGAIGHLINSWASGKRIFSVEIHAPGIFAEAEHEAKGYLYADGDVQGQVFDTKEIANSEEFYIYTGVQEAARDFADSCLNGGQPQCCFDNTLHTMKVAETILAQSLLAEWGNEP